MTNHTNAAAHVSAPPRSGRRDGGRGEEGGEMYCDECGQELDAWCDVCDEFYCLSCDASHDDCAYDTQQDEYIDVDELSM